MPEFPFGMWVTMTTVREMKPGTDRSIPRCCTTRVWPAAARMSTAANGHSAASALPPRLLGWKTALTTKSSPVASQMPAERRHRATRRAWRRYAAQAREPGG